MSSTGPRRGEMTEADISAAARLKAIWDRKKGALGLTQESAGHALGFNQSAVSQYLNGKIPLGVEVTLRWSALLGVDPSEIRPEVAAIVAGGLMTPSPTKPVSLDTLISWDQDTPLDDDEIEVPLYREVEMAAGAGSTHAVEINGRKLRFSKATMRAAGVDPANAACATLTGYSMWPLIQDGSTIGIDRGRTQLVDGEMYAIDHDGMLRVKYLHRLPGGGIRLRSENSDEYRDEEYSAENAKNIKILGWVFWWSTIRKWRGR